jgi:hypothetical protein
MEGILSERMLRKRRITGWAYLGSRAAEALSLLLLLKLANYIPLGMDQLWAEALMWSVDPESIVTNVDLFTGATFLVFWVGALYVSRQATELDADEQVVAPPPDKTSTEYYLWLTQPPPVRLRQEALNWLGETFLWGGVGLLLASALLHALLPTVGIPVLPTLLYFAFGVALLSQARFSVAHAGWQVQGIPVQHGIARRWLLWTAIFLVGIALIALVLPTDYAMGPILAIYSLLAFLAEGCMVVVALVTFLLAWLASLFFPGAEAPNRPPVELPPVAPEQAAPAAVGSSWLEALISAVFWVVILAILGYALFRFLRDRWGILSTEEAAEGTWWGRFLVWLRLMWQRFHAWRIGIQADLVRRRIQRREGESSVARLTRLFSLRRLSPAQLVRYFYVSIAKRAAQAGQPRRPGQTPYEFQLALDDRFPDLEPDLADLTDAFVKARYSRRAIEQEDADAVKPLWQRIKAALRRRRAQK